MTLRLSEQSWNTIRERYQAGHSAREVAAQFGISESTIHRRSSREKWRNELAIQNVPQAKDSVRELTDALKRLTAAITERSQNKARDANAS